MQSKNQRVLAAVLVAVAAVASLAAFPVNRGLVTDEAQILTEAERSTLETKLRAFEQRTSVEIAVVTVTSLGGMNIDEYRVALFKAWGIGKKGKDNGVLLVFAPNEPPSGKIGIEVGYGLEPILTDGATGSIARERIRPGWRSDHRANGILAGVDAIIERLDAARPAESSAALTVAAPPGDGGGPEWLVVFLVALGILAPVGAWIWANQRRRKLLAVVLARVEERDAAQRLATVREENRARHYPVREPPTHLSAGQAVQVRTTQLVTPPVSATAPAPEPVQHRSSSYESPSSSSSDWGSSSSSSSGSYDFGGGSSGGGGSSNDL